MNLLRSHPWWPIQFVILCNPPAVSRLASTPTGRLSAVSSMMPTAALRATMTAQRRGRRAGF